MDRVYFTPPLPMGWGWDWGRHRQRQDVHLGRAKPLARGRSNLTSEAFCRDEVMTCDDQTRTSKSEDPASSARRLAAVVPGSPDAAICLGASWARYSASGRSFPTGPEPQWHAYLYLGGPEVPFRRSA